jgi:hypothetical protein
MVVGSSYCETAPWPGHGRGRAVVVTARPRRFAGRAPGKIDKTVSVDIRLTDRMATFRCCCLEAGDLRVWRSRIRRPSRA